MHKTTVMIDENLLKEAMAATGARTKREAVNAGLKALIRIHHRESLSKELGTYDIELSLSDLEKMRNDDGSLSHWHIGSDLCPAERPVSGNRRPGRVPAQR